MFALGIIHHRDNHTVCPTAFLALACLSEHASRIRCPIRLVDVGSDYRDIHMQSSDECCICHDTVPKEEVFKVWAWGCGHKIHFVCLLNCIANTYRDIVGPPLPQPGVRCPVCRFDWLPMYDEILGSKMRIGQCSLTQFRVDEEVDMDDNLDDGSAPQHIIPLCCPRLLSVDGGFHECGYDRRMHWLGPSRTANCNWECLRCQSVVSDELQMYDFCRWPLVEGHGRVGQQCPIHGTMALAIERLTGDRYWICVGIENPLDVPMPIVGCRVIEVGPPVITIDDDTVEETFSNDGANVDQIIPDTVPALAEQINQALAPPAPPAPNDLESADSDVQALREIAFSEDLAELRDIASS